MQTRKYYVNQNLSIQHERNETDSSTAHNAYQSNHFSKSLPYACNARPSESTRLLVSSYPGVNRHRNSRVDSNIRCRTDVISGAYGSIEITPTTLQSAVSRNRRAGCFYLFLSIVIFLMIPYITTSLILVTVESQSKRLKFIYEILRNIYIFLSLILVCITLVKINRISIEIPESLRFREKQYIMTISTSGAIAFATLCLLAGALHTPKENYQYMTASTITVGQPVEVVVIFLQTILIIHSEHLVLRRPSLIIENCFGDTGNDKLHFLGNGFFCHCISGRPNAELVDTNRVLRWVNVDLGYGDNISIWHILQVSFIYWTLWTYPTFQENSLILSMFLNNKHNDTLS